MAKTKTKNPAKKVVAAPIEKKRIRKRPTYRSFKMTKKIKPPIQKKIPSVTRLLGQTLAHIWRNKRTFVGVLVIYLLLNFVLVKGLASTVDIATIKSELQQTVSGGPASINIALVGVLYGSGSGAASDVGSLYQSIILVTTTLAFIWLFRHTTDNNDKDIKVKQPFYEGMTPLVPFLLVACVVALQLLPMIVGVGVFSTVINNSLANTFLEQSVWALLAILLTILTFYLISSSVLALIIVTLPDTTPMMALRSAKKVIAFQRWVLMRKIFLMAVVVLVGFSALVLASITFIPIIAEWFFFIVSSLLLPILVGFVYKLYRALL